MAKPDTEDESLPQRMPDPPQTRKIELDFESLVAAAIAEVVIKPKKGKKPWRTRRRE